MKKINSILMILAAAAGFTNCSKADLVENKETGNGEAVVYATTDAATKTTLADDYKVLWSEGDQIKFVKDGASSTTYTFTLSSGSGTSNGTFTCGETPADGEYTVYYPATYDGSNWPAQTYVSATDISGALMKATATVSGGIVSDISFKNEGGILRYTVKGTKTIKSINVKSSSPALNVTLNCGDGVALATGGTVFNIALPAGTYSNATLRFTATDNTVATKTAGTFTVTKNKVSLATFESLTYLPEGALKGVFSVQDGVGQPVKQVRFSQGNLRYVVNGAKWGFYENQYDFCNTATYTGHHADTISLFTWGYDATNSIDPDGKEYVSGHYDDGESFDSTEDWGYVFGGESSVWRTLSTAEWQYLFNTRTASTVNGTANARYAKATVNSKAGVILLPDTYAHPEGVTALTYINTANAAFTANTYDLTNWNAMESAGAVFLPAAGTRDGFDVLYVGFNGYYWSSTAYDSSDFDYAYNVCFYSSAVYPNSSEGYRDSGFSVRLITDVK